VPFSLRYITIDDEVVTAGDMTGMMSDDISQRKLNKRRKKIDEIQAAFPGTTNQLLPF
jgi:hypothetical protein